MKEFETKTPKIDPLQRREVRFESSMKEEMPNAGRYCTNTLLQ